MKRLRIVISLCIIVSLFSGCNGQKGEIVTKNNDSVVISVLAGQSTSDAGIEDMIDEVIGKAMPNVKLEWECVDWGESFASQMRARFASNDIPDIMIGKAQDVKSYFGTGKLAVMDESLTAKIKQKALQAVTINKKTYGLPYNALYQGVIYNKKIFSKHGIQIPKTLPELEDVVKKLEQNNIIPFATHYHENWKIGNTTMQFMMNEIFKEDPKWGNKFRRETVDFTGNAKINRCLENNQYIFNHSWEDSIYIDQFESDSRFSKGEAAMYLTGTWSLQFASQYSAESDLGIFPFPNETGDAQLIRETNITFMKSTTTKYDDIIDQIFDIIISDQKLVQKILEFTQTVSVIKDVESDFSVCIQEDIDLYEKSGNVIEVTLGNNQLVWTYQNDIATQQLRWLKGEITLLDVLKYADSHRADSSNN